MEEHTHKFMRVKLGRKGYEVFKCMVPDCPTYIRKELVVGRQTICWRCGIVLIMNQWHATMKKPHCRTCTRPYVRAEEKNEEVVDESRELEEIEKGE